MKQLKITALFSMPRVGFTDNMFCAASVFPSLGIHLGRHCGAFWEQSLSMLLEACLERGDDYVITVDYDSVFIREQVVELIRLIETTGADAVCPVQIKRNCSRVLSEIHPDEIVHGAVDCNRPTTRIKAGHFGLTIIRCESLRKLPRPWLWSIPNADTLKWEEGKVDADINFWNVANTTGWRVLQSNYVRIGHIQRVITWPTSKWAVHQQYLDEWEANGIPEEVLEIPTKPHESGAACASDSPVCRAEKELAACAS